jgi:hypothetical protein
MANARTWTYEKPVQATKVRSNRKCHKIAAVQALHLKHATQLTEPSSKMLTKSTRLERPSPIAHRPLSIAKLFSGHFLEVCSLKQTS